MASCAAGDRIAGGRAVVPVGQVQRPVQQHVAGHLHRLVLAQAPAGGQRRGGVAGGGGSRWRRTCATGWRCWARPGRRPPAPASAPPRPAPAGAPASPPTRWGRCCRRRESRPRSSARTARPRAAGAGPAAAAGSRPPARRPRCGSDRPPGAASRRPPATGRRRRRGRRRARPPAARRPGTPAAAAARAAPRGPGCRKRNRRGCSGRSIWCCSRRAWTRSTTARASSTPTWGIARRRMSASEKPMKARSIAAAEWQPAQAPLGPGLR